MSSVGALGRCTTTLVSLGPERLQYDFQYDDLRFENPDANKGEMSSSKFSHLVTSY